MDEKALEGTPKVVICGAGIAGVAAAYFLAVRCGVEGVVLVDERPPLSLTSDKSTEAYRNWWPGPDDAMIRLMNRSIDLLEELAGISGNVFHLNRRGYLFATAEAGKADEFRRMGTAAARMGAGPLRIHSGEPSGPEYLPAPPEGYQGQPEGADLILERAMIRRHFPYLSGETRAVLHARRCGWFSGQQLGMYLLEMAREAGVRLLDARVEGVTVSGGESGRVESVRVRRKGASGTSETIPARAFVIAAGPMLKEVGAMLGAELPVFSERHFKAAFPDALGAIPREAPLLVWEDAQRLPWTPEERVLLLESAGTKWLLEELPPGVHARPEGGAGSRNILILWDYHPGTSQTGGTKEVFPLPEDPHFPEVVLRGMSAMVPGLSAYLERIPKPFVDGGYYSKTTDNRPLCGPLPIAGAYVLGALSGYGLMASCAAAELLAAHITGATLPPYAQAFSPQRFQNPDYLKWIESWGVSGQL